MLDINDVRIKFAAKITLNPDLNAALIELINDAYQKGLSDALQMPTVQQDPLAHMDTRVAAGMRSQAPAKPAQMATAGLSSDAGSDRQGGCPEKGNVAAVPEAIESGALATLVDVWRSDSRSFVNCLKLEGRA